MVVIDLKNYPTLWSDFRPYMFGARINANYAMQVLYDEFQIDCVITPNDRVGLVSMNEKQLTWFTLKWSHDCKTR